MRRKKALVTGASGGIGLELAKLLAARDHDLVLVARSASTLERVARELRSRHGVAVQPLARDLSLPDAPAQVFDEVGDVDVLINNAGFATYGKFLQNDIHAELEQLRLNIVTLTHLTHLFTSGMARRRSGCVLNVASTAAFAPGPLMAVYYASKAYVLSFSAAVAEEIVRCGVTVTCLCPGPTVTGFQQRANMENARSFRAGAADAASVARAGYDGMMRGQRIVIPGTRNRALAMAARITPLWLLTKVAKQMNESSPKYT